MKIKICGLKRFEDIDYVNESMPDFAGFIFSPASKRYISFEIAKLFRQKLDSRIKSVGVFVNEDISILKKVLDLDILDLIQLHGSETNEYIKEIKTYTKIPVIKAIKADNNLKWNIAQTNSDYVLIDSEVKNTFGGTGKKFDWGLIPRTEKKIFLAGGLNSKNIEDAIKLVNPFCLDINSGVETNGNKDRNKILEIIKIIKGYKYERN